jgi:DNA-binding protein YbaB
VASPGLLQIHDYMNQAIHGTRHMQYVDLEHSTNDNEQKPLRQLVGVAFREAKASLREKIPEAVANAAAHLQSKDDEDFREVGHWNRGCKFL